MAYQRPMVTVDQNITITPTSIERDQPAFVFGPNYELHRYDNADEKSKTAIGTFDGGKMSVEYPGAINGEAVDRDYTKLFGDNVVVKLADLENLELIEQGEGKKDIRAEKGGYTKLLFKDKKYLDHVTDGEDKGDEVENELPQNLVAGDLLVISYRENGDGAGSSESEAQQIVSKIVRVQYKATPWDIDSDASYDSNSGGTLVTIEDAIPETVDPESDISVGLVIVKSGVEFTRKNLAALESGESIPPADLWQWEQPVNGMVDEKTGKRFFGVKVNKLSVEVDGYFDKPKYCPVLFADLFVTFRELITSYSDTFHSLVGASEVANMLGTVDPDNPLAMGVYMAALNSATDDGDEAPPVYFMSVPSDDVDGYSAVLNKATLTDRAYVFAPTTRDGAVLELVRSHVLEMSTKTVKMWRIAAASAEVAETVDKLSAADNVQGKDYVAIPVSDGGTDPDLLDATWDKLRVVKSKTDTNGNTDTSFRSNLVVGDKVRFGYYENPWSEIQYDEYTVTAIINNYTVRVEGADGSGINTAHLKKLENSWEPSKIEIYHVYTSRESAEQVALTSKAMATRRMINVFPTYFRNNGVLMTGEFAACAVAGLISATEPQQPITNVTVRGIDDIPMVYQTYNNAELDLIASGGTFIVTQDLPGDRVYVRHQITTAYPDGNLNTAELSITKNVDSISYAFAEVFRPYYGKYNITPDLVAALRNIASQLIDQFAGSTSVYGPQLIAEETTIQYVRQNELMKDHVDIGIKLGVPYPCNNIDIVLTV